MASKPGDGSGSEVTHGVMKTVMRPSRQHTTNSAPVAERLPLDLQKLVNKEEQDKMLYEDSWTRTRPLDKFNEQHPDYDTNEPSECLPPELQKLVDKQEADRLLYEDSWTRTRPSDKFLESVTKPGGS